MYLRKISIKLICFLCLLSLIGCKHKIADTDFMDQQITNHQTTCPSFVDKQTTNKQSGTQLMRTNDTQDGIFVDDLLDSIEMLGKTASETGIPREVIDTESKFYIHTYLDGNIFGTKDYGILHFDEMEDDYLAKSIWIHIGNLGYDECKTQLSKKFGNSTEEGEEPFVEIDGGAVTWVIYRFQDIELRLSAASKRDFTELNIEKLTD